MASADNFINEEESKMTWLDKALMNYPVIYDTKELADLSGDLSADKERIVHPSRFDRAIAVLFLIFSTVAWLILFNMLTRYMLVPVTVVALLFVSLLIWINIWNTFLNRKYIYSIRFNKEYIEIDKKIIRWIDISDTRIMIRQTGRGKNSCLVIFTTDGQVHKYSLFKFAISDRELSTLIEVYKTNNKPLTSC